MQTSGPFSRRRFVGAAGAAVAAIAAPIAAPGLIRIAAAQSWRAGNPFSLGVASGAPRWLCVVDAPCARAAVDQSGNSGRHDRRRRDAAL